MDEPASKTPPKNIATFGGKPSGSPRVQQKGSWVEGETTAEFLAREAWRAAEQTPKKKGR